jgi:NAD(P)-dependent dehydrogenase (short-subunit alcohol dehydrogenase family)
MTREWGVGWVTLLLIRLVRIKFNVAEQYTYTSCCAVELARHNIQVNAIAPGFTATEINTRFFTPEVLKAIEFRLPMGRVSQPEEIAAAALAIVGGDMAFMTGQIIRVDGGWSASDIDYGRLGQYLGT